MRRQCGDWKCNGRRIRSSEANLVFSQCLTLTPPSHFPSSSCPYTFPSRSLLCCLASAYIFLLLYLLCLFLSRFCYFMCKLYKMLFLRCIYSQQKIFVWIRIYSFQRKIRFFSYTKFRSIFQWIGGTKIVPFGDLCYWNCVERSFSSLKPLRSQKSTFFYRRRLYWGYRPHCQKLVRGMAPSRCRGTLLSFFETV